MSLRVGIAYEKWSIKDIWPMLQKNETTDGRLVIMLPHFLIKWQTITEHHRKVLALLIFLDTILFLETF